MFRPDLSRAYTNVCRTLLCIVAEFFIYSYYSPCFHYLFNFSVMKLVIGGYQFELWSRRKEKHEHLKATYCLTSIFAQLSEEKMLGNLTVNCIERRISLSRIRYLCIYLFIFFRIICQVVNQHKISWERKKRNYRRSASQSSRGVFEIEWSFSR